MRPNGTTFSIEQSLPLMLSSWARGARWVKGSDRDAVAKRYRQEFACEVVHLLRVSSPLLVDVSDRGAVVDQEAQRLAPPPLEVVVKR